MLAAGPRKLIWLGSSLKSTRGPAMPQEAKSATFGFLSTSFQVFYSAGLAIFSFWWEPETHAAAGNKTRPSLALQEKGRMKHYLARLKTEREPASTVKRALFLHLKPAGWLDGLSKVLTQFWGDSFYKA